MPVIELSLSNLLARTEGKASEKEILETLPYLGLDLEGVEGNIVRVEYSPNRPDFSSEAGILRSLKGLLGIEKGTPKYAFGKSKYKIIIENDDIRKVRPNIFGIYASINMTDELIKQLIGMQEDLTNGIGRKRSKVAIGIHNAEVIKPPIRYFATSDKSFSFVPLYGSKPEKISTILSETVQGRQYSPLVSSGVYPLLEDTSKQVLSMPPIINGELTRLKPGARSLFIDVTSTEKKAGEWAAAICAAMLADSGARVETVEIEDSPVIGTTPSMLEGKTNFDLRLANKVLGLDLSFDEAKLALERSRLSLNSNSEAIIPRYRGDIIHEIDLVEEVLLGYGIPKLRPLQSDSSLAGSLSKRMQKIERIVDIFVGLGFMEIHNQSLTGKLEAELSAESEMALKMDDARSENFEFLKKSLLPNLLSVLGASTNEEYPQELFEVAPTFSRSVGETGVLQEEHAAGVVADSRADFTAIKSLLEGLLKSIVPATGSINFAPAAGTTGVFAQSRAAGVSVSDGKKVAAIGMVGEIAPEVLEKVGLKLPVGAFEINLESFLQDSYETPSLPDL